MPRENSKCRKWEKERRDRLNDGFSNLAKVLPCYDPSINICKIDILHKAAGSIQELQDRVKHLLSTDNEKQTEKENIIKKLQDRVKKLLLRNEQLSNLLRDAGITVPSVCGTIKKFKKQPLWSRKISPEQAEIRKNEMEKENIDLLENRKKKNSKATTPSNTAKGRTIALLHQKGRIRKNRKKKCSPVSNCYIVLPQSIPFRNHPTQQYYLITNQTNNNIKRNGVKSGGTTSKTVVKDNPTQHKTTVYSTSSATSLGPGTLILGNGVVVPVLPQPQPVITNSGNLLFNPTFYTIPKVVQMQEVNNKATKKVSTSGTKKPLPFIRPKYCLTRTTQVNKVPIPALTSSYASKYCLLNETENITSKKNDTEIVKPSKAANQGSNEPSKNDTSKACKRKNDTVEEITNKKCKNDVETEQSNTKSISSDTNEISQPVKGSSSTSEIQDDNVDINSKNIQDSNTLRAEEVEKNVTEKIIESPNNNLKIVNSENCALKEIASQNTTEKERETLVHQNNEIPQITSDITPVTTTSVNTTTHNEMKSLEINLPHSELSNDIFASLQVPSGCQNPESTSPTAAFLLAFPLVSSGVKVTEVIDGENSESQSGTPTLLQIGTMDTTKCTQSQSDVITSNFLNLDNFSFFSSKDICGSFDNSYPTASGGTSQVNATVCNNSKSEITSNAPIYMNIKSPSLPTSVADPSKNSCNIFCKKADTGKDISKDTKDTGKSQSKKFNENIDYNLPDQPISKLDLNFSIQKVGGGTQNSLAEKPQFHVSTTYPNSSCNFNYRPDLSKTCSAPICSCTTNINRNYSNPLYTNCNNYNYNYHHDNFNQNYYKNISRNESKSYYPYGSYPDYRKNETTGLTGKYFDSSVYMKEKKNNYAAKPKTTMENKQPINWMTAPDNRLQTSECLLGSFSKSNFNQTYPFTSYVTSASTYFSTSTVDANKMNCALEPKKCIDLPIVSLNSHQKMDIEEKQFSWSPTKLPHFLDPPHTFVTSTLPTLVGDLALGNTLPFVEQKNEYKPPKENKDFHLINRVNNYENQTNFLSVSQLVDHNKSESVPAKTTSRRNSGNRSKSNLQQKPKRVTKPDSKEILPHCGINNDNNHQTRTANNFNTFPSIDLFPEQKNKNPHKISSSSYSAEALIGNQVQNEGINKRYPLTTNKSLGASSFLAENIISYFPPVDFQQDNYMTQNQNYQTNNFSHNLASTTLQNNTYSSNSFIYTASSIASSYLGTNNFDPGPQDYLSDSINLLPNPSKDNKHCNIKNCNKQVNKEEKNNQHSICSNNVKKPKKKSTSDTNTLFDFPFLSMPGSNNSPILPDDFHTHTNFLAPTTPFSCKNSLYPKQNNDIGGSTLLPLPPVCRSTIQHPEISPSINAVGTSLTNFNLSTIFPEINKGPISDMYQDTRIKDHHKSYNSTAPQVPFNSEPKFNFST